MTKARISRRCEVVTFIVLAAFCVQDLRAQELTMRRQSVGMAGASISVAANGGTWRVQQSTGQGSVIGLYHANGKEIRQGFLQPLHAGSMGKVDEPLIIDLFPNPCSDGFNLRSVSMTGGSVHVELFDLSGRSVLRKSRSAWSELFVPTESIGSGAYIVRVRIGDRAFTTHLQKY